MLVLGIYVRGCQWYGRKDIDPIPVPPNGLVKLSNNLDGLDVYYPCSMSYFALWLFIMEDVRFSQPMTININHCNILHRNMKDISLQSGVKNLSSLGKKMLGSSNYVVGSEHMIVLPYVVDIAEGVSKQSIGTVQSIANTNFQLVHSTRQDVPILVEELTANSPSLSDYDTLCDSVGLERGKSWIDIVSVFKKYPLLGTSIGALNDLCIAFGAPFTFNVDKVKNDYRLVVQANLFFKKWFQWRQPVCFSFVDGNHRAWACCRFFSGQQFSSAVPVPVPTAEDCNVVDDESFLIYRVKLVHLYSALQIIANLDCELILLTILTIYSEILLLLQLSWSCFNPRMCLTLLSYSS